MNDLSVSINHLGREYDFEQLSGGEANRLVLALSWSFRDVFEHLNHSINLLMIDEIVDTGMDSQGMDAALTILKKLAREKSKNIFLISHKDELQARVDNILIVQKENGFSTYIEQ
jgi:DNA repair exonuclease SbcCD ATPase subunit